MSDPAGDVQANPARRREISPAPIRKSVVVHAPAARAFAFFTSGMDRWWRPEHHIATNPFAEIVMEPRAGGRWFERDRDGAECEWGKVLVWNPPEQVVLAWAAQRRLAVRPRFHHGTGSALHPAGRDEDPGRAGTSRTGKIRRQGRRRAREPRFAGRLERCRGGICFPPGGGGEIKRASRHQKHRRLAKPLCSGSSC